MELAPTQQSAQKLVNFGTSRQFKVIKHLTVTANKPLPPDLLPDQINYDAVLSRTGSTLETAEFPEPTFSPAYISHDRRSISFAVCLNPVGIAAGKYVGSITVSGPEGLGSTAVNLTVNAKKKQTLAWLIARPSVTAPIASATNLGQLDSLIAATKLELSAEAIGKLDVASAWR